jgi:hypothetical protein
VPINHCFNAFADKYLSNENQIK